MQQKEKKRGDGDYVESGFMNYSGGAYVTRLLCDVADGAIAGDGVVARQPLQRRTYTSALRI